MEPLVYVAVLMLIGLALARLASRLSLAVQTTSLTLLLSLGFEALPNAILKELEWSYVHAPADLSGYVGMVILGGVFVPGEWMGTRDITVNDAAERALVPLGLVRKFPDLRIIFSGGDGQRSTASLRPESDRARVFFDAMGVAPNRIIYEGASKTTAENALFCSRLTGVNVREPWLLVTSAWHMPRSIAAFHKAGWSNITALPVDFRSSADMPTLSYSLDRSLSLWRVVLHEYAGLVWYRVNGVA